MPPTRASSLLPPSDRGDGIARDVRVDGGRARRPHAAHVRRARAERLARRATSHVAPRRGRSRCLLVPFRATPDGLFLVPRYALRRTRRAGAPPRSSSPLPVPCRSHSLHTLVTPHPSPAHPHPPRQVHAPRPAARRCVRADGGACVWVVVGSSAPTRRLVVVWFVFSDGV